MSDQGCFNKAYLLVSIPHKNWHEEHFTSSQIIPTPILQHNLLFPDVVSKRRACSQTQLQHLVTCRLKYKNFSPRPQASLHHALSPPPGGTRDGGAPLSNQPLHAVKISHGGSPKDRFQTNVWVKEKKGKKKKEVLQL